MRYLISIATYRRPDQLQRLLDSLAVSVDSTADVVVVDNDSEASAREVAQNHAVVKAYEVESEPGIASARNRGLGFFTDDYGGIIFVDDDEWVEPSWYQTLARYAESTAAGVVNGPVETILPAHAPAWMMRGGFYQRVSRPTGTALESAATNNTLLKRDAWEAAGCPRFDVSFSSTGGSDWELFWRIRDSGSRIVFCAEALVSEDVPESRLSWQWLRQRMVRSGIVGVRVRQKHDAPMAKFYVRAFLSGVRGAMEMTRDFILRRGRHASSANRLYVNLGRLAGALGKRIHEYKRV